MGTINHEGKALRLLVVDDTSADLAGVLGELTGYDATVERVQSADQVVIAFTAGPWDAVLAIHGIANGTTLRVLKLLAEKAPDTPCIVLARHSDEASAIAAMREGAADYLRFDESGRLGATIARAMREAETRRARRQADLALLESEERHRAVSESAFDLICEIDSEGCYTYLSPNYPQVLGYAAAELLGSPVFERLHPDDKERVVTEYAAAMAALRLGQAEFRHQHKTGDWRWFESTLRALRSGNGPKRVVMISRDITSHKRHEQELATLISLSKAINAQTGLEGIARELTAHLQPLLPFDALVIALAADDGLALTGMRASGDQIKTRIERSNFPECPLWDALARNDVWLVNHANFLHCGMDFTTRAFIDVPLSVDGHTFGVLHFNCERPYVFTEEHARLAKMVAEQVAVAVRQVHLLEQTRQAEEKLRALVNEVNAIVWEAEPGDLRLTFISPQAELWLGYSREMWLRDVNFWTQCVHPDDRDRVIAERRSASAHGSDNQFEYRAVSADGRVLWLRELVSVEMEEGRPVRVRGISIDVTEKKRAEASLVESNTILKATQEASADGICLVDDRGAVVSFNHRFIEMWRIPAELIEELRDKRQLMACVLSSMQKPDEFVEKINFLHAHPEASSRDEITLRDGRLFERYSAPALAPGGHSYGRVWSFSDITERKRYEQQLAHQAFHDALTDLPNRTLFMDRVNHALARIGRAGKCAAVLFLDLDRFKVVNDSMGHEKGDWLLMEVANRLQQSMRPGDTAARFGGDEFTLLLEDLNGIEDATTVTERIAESLQAAFNFEGREIYITCSIGIALSTTPGDRAEDLLRNADVAMYRAKNKGKARYEVFDMEMSASALDKLQLEIELRQAVKWKQLRLDYQPLVDLESGRTVGVEALVRWQHPQRGLIAPADFIPIAEESGQIVPIGKWVLETACAQARQWQIDYPSQPPLRISVNISAKQFQHSNLVEDVKRVLRETQLDPHSLELEITESAIMEDAQTSIDQLEILKGLGVHLAIDDFGTGYSSLSYIERFPLDVLKIDRSFVSQIGKNGKNGHGPDGPGKGDGSLIMQAVSTLGKGLGVTITAEGIETPEQLAHLRGLGCNIGQGFIFARPLGHEEIADLLRGGVPHEMLALAGSVN